MKQNLMYKHVFIRSGAYIELPETKGNAKRIYRYDNND